MRILIRSGFYWGAQFNAVATAVITSISIDSVKNLQRSQFFTLQSPKNEMTTEKRKGEQQKEKRFEKEFEFYHLLFHFQFNMLILSRSMHQINTAFYLSTFDLFTTFYRLFRSKIFKEIISKAPLFFKIRLFW